MKFTHEEQLILAAFKLNPDLGSINRLNSALENVKDWSSFSKIAIERGLAPLLHKQVHKLSNAHLIPPSVKELLKQTYFRTLSRSMLMYAHFDELCKLFKDEGLNFIPLKGVYLSKNLYKDVALRQFSDMDLLFKPVDGPRALLVLDKIGYKATEDHQSVLIQSFTEIIHYMPMVKQEVSVEVHIKLHSRNTSYFLDPVKVWEKAEQYESNGFVLNRMAYNDLLIHVALHLDKHFQKSSLQFTCYLDLVNLVENKPLDFSWDNFEARCDEYNCKNEVFLHLILAERYLYLNLEPDLIAKYSYLLNPKMDKLFVNHFRGKSVKSGSVDSHLNNLSQLNFAQQIKYLVEVVFPNPEFMYSTYKIKRKYLLPLYYPYRHWIGLKGFVNAKFNS